MSNEERNKQRFDDIIKGRVRKELREFIKSEGIFGQRGRDLFTIPIHRIDIPKFKRGKRTDDPDSGDGDGNGDGSGKGKGKGGGIGQGSGNPGDKLGPGEGEGDGDGKDQNAGQGTSDDVIEIELEKEEFAKYIREELELPDIEKKREAKKIIYVDEEKFSGLRRVGPDALRRLKPTFLNALKRTLASGEYNFDDPIITLEHDDFRYLSWRKKPKPETNAVIFYIMDVSGSFDENHRRIARKCVFLTDLLLRVEYKGIESIFMIHDWEAEEVSEEDFYGIFRWGGTRFSSASELTNILIDKKFPSDIWNIYVMHFTDGFNWPDDNKKCFEIIKEELEPKTNKFFYAQINYDWWSADPYYARWGNPGWSYEGEFLKELKKFAEQNNLEDYVRMHQLKKDEDVYPEAVRAFFGKKKK